MWGDCGIIPIQTQLRYGKSAKSKNDRYAKMTNMPVKRTNIDFYAINFQNLTWSAFFCRLTLRQTLASVFEPILAYALPRLLHRLWR